MAVVDVCALTLTLVILTAIPSGQAADNNTSADTKDPIASNQTYRLHKTEDISGNEHNVSPKALSVARAIVYSATKFLSFGNTADVSTARKQMMSYMMNPYFLIPQMIMLGFAPIVLANLKMLVMKALMMNNMALSTAVFMTLRSLVFGPSPGPQIKYINYGYRNPHSPHPHSSRDKRSLRL